MGQGLALNKVGDSRRKSERKEGKGDTGQSGIDEITVFSPCNMSGYIPKMNQTRRQISAMADTWNKNLKSNDQLYGSIGRFTCEAMGWDKIQKYQK